MGPLALVVAECEDFILSNRAANGAAKLVPITTGNLVLAGRDFRRSLRERVAGKIGVGALEIECRTVNFVGARLGLGSHDGANGLSKFGVVVLGSNLHFVNRIEIWIDDDNSEDGILIVRAVQFEASSGEMLSVG